MSGRKRIQVDESEWYRLQRKAQQLKEVRRNLPQLLDGVREQTRADIDRTFRAVEDRQRGQDQALRNLSEQTRQLEQDTTRRLREQARELHQALDATAGQIREETRRQLARQQEATRRAIAAERAERRAEMARLNQEVDLLKQDREQARSAVRTWLADAREMAGLIGTTLPHERFAPGALAKLTSRLATAEQNEADGRYDAALALAQETYHGLSELRWETEQMELDRCAAQTAAIEALVRTDKLIEENAVRPVLGSDGTPLPGITLDVGYWSGGALEELHQRTSQALLRARDDATDPEELRELEGRVAPELERMLGDTVERAGMRQLASQLRVNLADAVAHTLSEYAYYDLVDGAYDQADPRGTYYAKLRHMNGNEIVVDVAQRTADSGECVVRVHSYDHDTTAEEDLAARAGAIHEALRAGGHEAAEPSCEPGTADRALLDFARHREQRQPGGPEERQRTVREPRRRPGPGTAGA
ncbi:hypothetical protein [Streptomyces sp. NPDC059169]|uniref:hypothetical protein n=1 Tax=unclassified Streptomyces TaxID=2593676 RepID=UPI0036B70E39